MTSQSWNPGEREIGTLVVEVAAGVPFGLLQLKLTDAQMRRTAPPPVPLRSLEPLLFVTS